MSSTLQALRAKSAARVLEEKKALDRRRELLVLTAQFLLDQGLVGAAEVLQQEAGISLQRLGAADNVDLPLVFQHFVEYYEMRFGRPPKVLRKIAPAELAMRKAAAMSRAQRPRSRTEGPESKHAEAPEGGASGAGPTKTPAAAAAAAAGGANKGQAAEISVSGVAVRNQAEEQAATAEPEQKLLKPLSIFLDGTSGETRELAQLISRDIFTENPNVRWDDVVGLDDAKRLLKEAMVMPIRYPQLFRDALIAPWKGVLLYGPPGTGKTMLAKAVATECRTTFFNISASSIVSRYRGDSEKLVRILFDLARYHAPSTIFLDEIDSIMGQRGGEHEATRRMKTELLIQMDGLARSGSACGEEDRVFVLAASNLPWELDAALLRRLEKRVLVRLPERAGRQAVFSKHLPPGDPRTDGVDHAELAARTEGYSCADVALVCKEAAMYPVRRLMAQLEDFEAAAPPAGRGRPPADLSLGPVTQADALGALERTRPSAHSETDAAYQRWQAEFGSS